MRSDPVVLVHFVASWAEAICGPHRAEVAEAARRIGGWVVEYDVDAHQDVARSYAVLTVHASLSKETRPDHR